ncbi:hypothetical protein [Variovorax sp. KBW07]|uniref:hypothetical protein n=1 Tax=Variovorax sp. KBW07 TaxID=2153358 RepID=UPI0021AA3D45|nr:hypothetical protein [Variovorax sp. KBW07]
MHANDRSANPPVSPSLEGDALLEALIARPADNPGRRGAQGIVLGTLVDLGADRADGADGAAGGVPRVRLAGMGTMDVLCSLVPLAPTDVGSTVALGFSGSDMRQAIILGLVWEPREQRPAAAAVPHDDTRVVIEAKNEIELRCGESALILSADGRIQLRGHYITSHASATQRILGGSVNVN